MKKKKKKKKKYVIWTGADFSKDPHLPKRILTHSALLEPC
jgi:hypothetical protein